MRVHRIGGSANRCGIDIVGLCLQAAMVIASAAIAMAPAAAWAEEQTPAAGATIDSTIEAAEADTPLPPYDQKLVKWNDFKSEDYTLHFGLNAMYDAVGTSQDPSSVDQWGNIKSPDSKMRDFRLLASGKFPKSKRLIEWKVGYMYDGLNDQWLFRETGLVVATPEIWGHLFIGRTKLGVSMIKHMSGASIMGLERSEIEDMTIPIQNDGIRWMGYLPKQRLVWNLGYFNETLLKNPLYPFMDQQYAARVALLPLLSEADGQVLHLAVNLKYGNPKDDKTQLKARPEASTSPYFLDTGVFPAEHEKVIGPELWYRNNSWLFGSAYYFVKTEASQGDHQFDGGDMWVSWLMTGEVRKYNTRGALFDFVYPKHSLFKGGMGAFEATLHATYTDANSGIIQGGKFWRVSPMFAWYPSYEFRVTVGYGYGVLDRFGTSGATQYFQGRIQFML
jgi:phosphate-selective porin OprO and OprP